MIFEYLLCVSDSRSLAVGVSPLPLSWTESLGPRAGIRDHETRNLSSLNRDFVESPIGIEPMTHALRGARSRAVHALAALMAPISALMAPSALDYPATRSTPEALASRHPATVRNPLRSLCPRLRAGLSSVLETEVDSVRPADPAAPSGTDSPIYRGAGG
jgi:hypothetical protein